MDYTIDWAIEIGEYRLLLLASCEIHDSVDLLANTCVMELPAIAYNKTLNLEEQVKRGDKVRVSFGYNGNLEEEFTGYLLNVATDDGKTTINCEDDMFLFRKAIPDVEFVNKSVEAIAAYALKQSGVQMQLKCMLSVMYDKFVVSNATAFDVLKKLKEETKGLIYVQNGILHVHPPYLEKAGEVEYSFQQNIEKCDLKYIRKEDRKIEIVVSATGSDGKKKEVRYGSTGGEQISVSGAGMSESGMKQVAENEYKRRWFDGYEGSITTWLIPFVRPAYTASITDEEYEYKDGSYYVSAVTTTISEAGGVRKVQLGIRVS